MSISYALFVQRLLILFLAATRVTDSLKTRFVSTSITSTWALFCSQSDNYVPQVIERCDFEGTGSILLAHKGEYDHFLMKSAILIFEHNERGTVGAILNKPSAFTMGEMAANIGVFQPNTLFTGGSDGTDTAVMFHKYDLGGYSKPLGNGLYVGGLKEAKETVEAFNAHPNDFKFIFNNVQWGPGLLKQEIDEGRWEVIRMPPEIVLRQDGSAVDIWSTAKNALL
mmetsp:Transcript_9139/g.15135  ORF Transcript_9139/g.15135 Transcript_9139/m.15135 type:complete len:225 (+) Transcript_9139:120-794(+)